MCRQCPTSRSGHGMSETKHSMHKYVHHYNSFSHSLSLSAKKKQVYSGGVSKDDSGDYHYIASQSLEWPKGMTVHEGLQAASSGLSHAMDVIDYATDPTYSGKPPLKDFYGKTRRWDATQGEKDLEASKSITDQVVNELCACACHFLGLCVCCVCVFVCVCACCVRACVRVVCLCTCV